MITDGPITPPLSPGHSEDGHQQQHLVPAPMECDVSLEPTEAKQQHAQAETQVQVKPAVLQVMRPDPGSRRASREAQQSEERMAVDEHKPSEQGHEPAEGGKPPARHLEDEQSHVQRGGPLRLIDFEVKGTLGAYCPCAPHKPHLHDLVCTRYRHLWPRPPR